MSRVSKNKFVKGIAAGGIVLASLGTLTLGNYQIQQPAESDETEASAPASAPGETAAPAQSSAPGGADGAAAPVIPADAEFVPGTYTASATGMESQVTVEATFDEHSMTDIVVDVSGETDGLGAAIGDAMTAKFKEAQSYDVDGEAGCTVTSNALKAAVADCYSQALGQAAGAESGAEAAEAAEPGGTGEAAAPDLSGDTTFVPGTYTASAAGMESDVTVQATFDEHSLTDIVVDVSGETDGLGAAIGDAMAVKFKEAQSYDVDGEAGCTVTSDALKAAVADCFNQALGQAAGTESETESSAEETEAAARAADQGGAVESAEPVSSGDAMFIPGTYTAFAAGMESQVMVQATFDEHSMTDIVVDVSGETEGVGAAIGNAMAAKFKDAQSYDVDGEAGCTVTSDALKAALSECFTLASVQTAGEKSNTENAEAPVQNGTDDSAAPVASAAVESAAPAVSADNTFVPGTYTAYAAGMESTVTVQATFDEHSMTDIVVDVSGETEGLGAAIGDTMAAKFKAAQSYDVDGEAGCTVTSNALKTALASCFELASAQAAGAEADNTESGKPAEAPAGTEAAESAAPVSSEESAFVPGTYTAFATGMESQVMVQATFDEHSMTDIVVDVSGETEGVGAAIGDAMIAKFKDAQSFDVDGESGSTITSDALKAALSECFNLASVQAAVEDSGEEETEAPAEASAENETEEAATEAQSEADESAAPAQAEAANESAAPVSSEEPAFVPGTYTAFAAGMESQVMVQATFDEHSMTDIVVDVSGETEGVGAAIGDAMITKFKDAQSFDVDGESGSTITSDALKTALSNCFELASVHTAGAEVNTEAESETEAPAEAPAETEAAEPATEAQSEKEEAAVPAQNEADESAAPVSSGDAAFIPGTYTAFAAGMESSVMVQATFDEHSITDIVVDVSGETADLGAAIGDAMIAKFMEAQYFDVDGEAGCTITSDALKAALSNCFELASAPAAEAESDTEA